MCIRNLIIGGLLGPLAAIVGGGQPVTAPAPLLPAAARIESPGDDVLTLVAARRAQEMGLPSAAAELYRRMLKTPDEAGADRSTLILGLATALLDEGRVEEADQTLDSLETPRGAAWHLRKGLVAAAQHRLAASKNERDASRVSELSPADRAWHLYLQGTIATAEGEHDKAAVLFNQAQESAGSMQARARFLLKLEEARLRRGQVSEADAVAARKNMEQFQGRGTGYDYARIYAAMLDSLGRKGEAVAVLQRQIVALPPEERSQLDEMRLLLGLIAGAGDGAGRNALERLLERGSDRDKQRIALQLLARASTKPPQLVSFRKQLDELIAALTPHPILEDLLLFRAQAALASKTSEGYAQAESDAALLLQKFPGSPLKVHAYGVLTDSAWEQLRYRTAADNAEKARAELAPGPERAALGVLIAEARFRARDFRSAADAYAASLRERPAGVSAGELMFQRIVSEIEAGAPDAAAMVLDELARDPAFDAVNRWQAEWNLARGLQARGKIDEAYARVNRLLGEPGASLGTGPAEVELRARMAWLQARLSLAAKKPEDTLKFVDALAVSTAGVPPGLKNEITSSSELLRAEASFALGRDAAALATLKKLREDFPRFPAAVNSYFLEADHFAKQDKTVEAQQLLTKLADDFPQDPYAPFALFQAALQAERRGQEANFKEAFKLIEDMVALIAKYPNEESQQLIFPARLKQGDLLRKLNQFPQAQHVYEELLNNYAQRDDIALAQLALAETHNALSANEPSHAESALVLFEHVLGRVNAPVDARVEAGFNLGHLLARRGDAAKAQEVWWRDVVTQFLLEAGEANQLHEKGRFWMTRTLIELGGLYEQQEKLEQAKEAWQLILKAKLGYGETLAKARLARFNLGEVKQ